MSDPKHLDCPGCIGFSDEHTCPGHVEFEAMRKAKDRCHACATKNAKIERLRAVLQRIADMPVDGYESTIPVRSIARVALEDDNENDDTDGAGVNTDWLRDDAGR